MITGQPRIPLKRPPSSVRRGLRPVNGEVLLQIKKFGIWLSPDVDFEQLRYLVDAVSVVEFACEVQAEIQIVFERPPVSSNILIRVRISVVELDRIQNAGYALHGVVAEFFCSLVVRWMGDHRLASLFALIGSMIREIKLVVCCGPIVKKLSWRERRSLLVAINLGPLADEGPIGGAIIVSFPHLCLNYLSIPNRLICGTNFCSYGWQ